MKENNTTTSNPPPIKWEDVVSIDKNNYFSGNVYAKPEVYVKRIEKFLDQFQETENGQEILSRVKHKYGDSKVSIGINDYFTSMIFPDGEITIDVREENSLAFIDQNSSKPMSIPLERIILHELIHASDPRIKIGQENKDKCHSTLIENYAVSIVDKYSKECAPEFGIRASYDNMVGATKTDNQFQTITEDPIKLIKNSPELQRKIQASVANIKSVVESCTDTTEIFNDIALPISKSNKIEKY